MSKTERESNLVPIKKPKINISGSDLPTLTKTAWNALRQRNNPPYLFNFGGSPHRLEDDDAGLKTLKLLKIDRLRNETARGAHWVKTIAGGNEVPTFPPVDVIKDMLAEPEIPFPTLKRLSEIPHLLLRRQSCLPTRLPPSFTNLLCASEESDHS